MIDFNLKPGSKIPLATIPLAAIVAKANLEKTTVIIGMKHSGLIKNIFIKEGNVVFANSNSKTDGLRHLLTEDNRLSPSQLAVVDEHITKNKTPFLDTIISLGYFQKDSVDKLKLKQIEHILVEFAAVKDAIIEIIKSDSVFSKIQHFDVPVYTNLAKGLMQHVSVEIIKKAAPDIIAENCLIITERGNDNSMLAKIPPEAKGVLTIVESSPKIAEVLSSSFLNDEEVIKYLYFLKIFGFITIETQEERDGRILDAGLTDEDRVLKEQLINTYESFKVKTYYEILDVLEDANQKELNEALENLKDKFEPGKFQRLFWGKNKEIPVKILELINEAYKILSDEKKRTEYDSFVARGEAGSFKEKSATLGLDESLNMAREEVKNKNYMAAIPHFEKATELAPKDPYLMCEYAGVLYDYSGGINHEILNKALDILKKAHSIDPGNFRIFTLFGQIFKRTNKSHQAIESYKKALLLNPNCAEAEKELSGLDPKFVDCVKIQGLYNLKEKMNYYQLLNIDQKAGSDQVKKAYYALTKKVHPDKHYADESQELKDMTKAVYKQIVEAYMVLKNPTKRQEYDTQLGEFKPEKDIRLKDAADVIQKKEKSEITFASSQAKKFFELGMTSLQLKKLNAAKINFQLALQADPNNIVIKRKLKDVIDMEKEVED